MQYSAEEQLEILCQGTAEVLPLDDFDSKLKASFKSKKPLVIKFGVDPTSPDLHLGHAVILRKLRQFQDLGHTIILLIGDFTARIGDPSQRSVTRPQLTAEQVKTNAKTYTDQAFKVILKDKTTIDYNSRWFLKIGFDEILKLVGRFTVARMLERDDFAERYAHEKPIGLHEFLYPVMQAYDSVVLSCDIEIGGTDQKFNMLSGRDLQREFGHEAQVVITMPILEGTDGVQKMSKSLDNHIGLTDLPEEMFGKVMSIPDELMIKYFHLTTGLPFKEVDLIDRGLGTGELHPAEIKRRLAREIVTIYYAPEIAEKAEHQFNIVFKEKKLPVEIPEFPIPSDIVKDGRIWIIRLIVKAGLAQTSSEARRLIEQGGIKLDGKVIKDINMELVLDDLINRVLQVGKRRFVRLI